MIFIIDFDGTCTTHVFPGVGKNIGAEFVLRKLIEKEHQIILYTMRSNKQEGVNPNPDSKFVAVWGNHLDDAVNWFKENDIPLYGIQTNPEQHIWTDSPKPYGHYIIDDIALGIPLMELPQISERPFVNWHGVNNILYNNKIYSYVDMIEITENISDYFLNNYNNLL